MPARADCSPKFSSWAANCTMLCAHRKELEDRTAQSRAVPADGFGGRQSRSEVELVTALWDCCLLRRTRSGHVPVGLCNAVRVRWRVTHLERPAMPNATVRSAGGQVVGRPRR